MQVIMNSGVGGVGKTVTVNRAAEILTERDIAFTKVSSVTREVYANKGISTEINALTLPIDVQTDLQASLLDAYLENLKMSVRSAYDQRLSVVLVDRSPFDYVSYRAAKYLYESRALMDSDLERVRNMFYSFSLKLEGVNFSTYLYPYPVPWARSEDVSSDGFRADVGMSNLVWDCVLKDVTNTGGPYLSVNTFWASATSIEQRANTILRVL